MSAFKNKNSLRTIEAEISENVKNNEARPKFTGSYFQKKRVIGPAHELEPLSSPGPVVQSAGFLESCGGKNVRAHRGPLHF